MGMISKGVKVDNRRTYLSLDDGLGGINLPNLLKDSVGRKSLLDLLRGEGRTKVVVLDWSFSEEKVEGVLRQVGEKIKEKLDRQFGVELAVSYLMDVWRHKGKLYGERISHLRTVLEMAELSAEIEYNSPNLLLHTPLIVLEAMGQGYPLREQRLLRDLLKMYLVSVGLAIGSQLSFDEANRKDLLGGIEGILKSYGEMVKYYSGIKAKALNDDFTKGNFPLLGQERIFNKMIERIKQSIYQENIDLLVYNTMLIALLEPSHEKVRETKNPYLSRLSYWTPFYNVRYLRHYKEVASRIAEDSEGAVLFLTTPYFKELYNRKANSEAGDGLTQLDLPIVEFDSEEGNEA